MKLIILFLSSISSAQLLSLQPTNYCLYSFLMSNWSEYLIIVNNLDPVISFNYQSHSIYSPLLFYSSSSCTHISLQLTVFNIEEFLDLSLHPSLLPLPMLGSKTLETNVLEFQFVLCWQIMIKTYSPILGFLKMCLIVKLESSNCRN